MTDQGAALASASTVYRLTQANVRIDGVPFNAARYPFLVELYDDPWPEIVVRKGSQLGLTSWAVLLVIDRMRTLYPRGVLYGFPTDDEVYDFAQSRFERILTDNPAMYEGVVQGTDRVVLKRIAEAYLYFRGMRQNPATPTKRRSKLLSIPVDLIVFDEFNEMDPVAVATALQRVSGSEFQHVIKFGHPSIPQYGIDAEWEKSDQRHWMIQCSHCGKHTCLELTFPECINHDVDADRHYRACTSCGKEIAVIDGEWVPSFPDREVRGYWPSQLLSPTVDPGVVLSEYDEVMASGRNIQTFWNFRLGQPWADIDEALDASTVLELCNADEPVSKRHEGPCAAGFDVGARKIYGAIGYRPTEDRLQVVAWPEVETFDEVFDLGKRYNIQAGVIDCMAETRTVREFCNRATWAWGCFYSEGQKHNYKWNGIARDVTVNRTESLDASHLSIIDKRVKFPRNTSHFEAKVVPQLVNLARTVLEDPVTGARKPRWVVRGSKHDHWRHAYNYLVLAADRLGLAARTRRERESQRNRLEPPTPDDSWMAG
jgi:hypothetical protein